MLQDQHLDFFGVAEIRNVLLQNLAVTTSLTKAGMMLYNSGDNHFYGHNGTAAKRILWSDDTEAIPTLATAPTTPVTAQKWYDAATNDIKYFNSALTKTIATVDQIQSMFRIRSSAFNAAPGLLPVMSDNNVAALANVPLALGDTFLVTSGGTIAGIGGNDTLEPGDMLVLFDATAPTTAASWWGFNTNVSIPANIVAFENVTVSLTANANATITPTVLTGIHDVTMYDSTGEARPSIDLTFTVGAASATANSVRTLPNARAFCLGVAGAATIPTGPPDQPTIGTGTTTAQAANLVTLQWPITMASTGVAATSLTVDLFDATDTGFASPLATQQVITTGIGLGATLNVTFANVNGFNGVTPISFVIRAVAA